MTDNRLIDTNEQKLTPPPFYSKAILISLALIVQRVALLFSKGEERSADNLSRLPLVVRARARAVFTIDIQLDLDMATDPRSNNRHDGEMPKQIRHIYTQRMFTHQM